jgi:hypothetical protein
VQPSTRLSPTTSVVLARQNRRHRRHRVHLEVRFGSARDYLVEYAENLSRGGLFVRGIFDVEPLQIMSLEIELPGFRRFEVRGRVVHVRSAADAVAIGAKPGVGLELIDLRPDFTEALHHYLTRLGRRSEVVVLSTSDEVMGLLATAGYQVFAAPAPGQVQALVATLPCRVLALALGRRERDDYLAAETLSTRIVEIDFLAEIDEILEILDALMLED